MGFVIDNLSFGSDLQMDSWIFTLFTKWLLVSNFFNLVFN
jgi:hypothetical protein